MSILASIIFLKKTSNTLLLLFRSFTTIRTVIFNCQSLSVFYCLHMRHARSISVASAARYGCVVWCSRVESIEDVLWRLNRMWVSYFRHNINLLLAFAPSELSFSFHLLLWLLFLTCFFSKVLENQELDEEDQQHGKKSFEVGFDLVVVFQFFTYFSVLASVDMNVSRNYRFCNVQKTVQCCNIDITNLQALGNISKLRCE